MTGVLAATAALVLWALVAAGPARADHQVTELVSTGPAGGNSDFDVGDFRISADGSRSLFRTTERLVPGDTDDQLDLYERSGGTTSLLSTGPLGGNGPFPVSALLFRGISRDGSHVIFRTQERLTDDDTDDHVDVYQRSSGTTTLVSIGPVGGNGTIDAGATSDVPWISADGTTIVLVTTERLMADDSNSVPDFYLRRNGQTTLISPGPPGPFSGQLFQIGLSADGRRVFFTTDRRLSPDDTDFAIDVYKWEGGQLTQESVGPNGEDGSANAFASFINETGSRLFFGGSRPLVPGAPPDAVYERSGGTTRLVTVTSTGQPSGGQLAGVSADGTHAFFRSPHRLVPVDTDDDDDLYVRANGETKLMSAGPLAGTGDVPWVASFTGASADGSRALFVTQERLTAEDTDGTASAYEYTGGESARLLAPAFDMEISRDGSRVFVATNLPLLPSDTDPCTTDAFFGPCSDIYEIRSGELTLISTGPLDAGQGSVCRPPPDPRSSPACQFSISEDGTRVLFWHSAPLLPEDTDNRFDAYLASAPPHRSEYPSAAAFCEAERDFLGIAAFREHYGKGSKGKNAFRKCVHVNR